MPTSTTMAPIRTFRVLAGAFMSALVIIGIALSAAVGDHKAVATAPHGPSGWVYVVIVVLGVGAAGIVQAVGYRLPALSPGLDEIEARQTALMAYHVWPSDSLIQRVQERLDCNGGRSRLADVLYGRA